jgi:hypothetical protein
MSGAMIGLPIGCLFIQGKPVSEKRSMDFNPPGIVALVRRGHLLTVILTNADPRVVSREGIVYSAETKSSVMPCLMLSCRDT